MKATCTVALRNGAWSASHSSATLGSVQVTAGSRSEVVAKMREELQYRIELCPCSGASGDTVVLDVKDAAQDGRPGWDEAED